MSKWRALLRVEVKGLDGVGFIIPAISPTEVFYFKNEELPLVDEWHRDKRLHARVNIEATKKEELDISDWEID